jgi:SAM-dependent methyltransferase
MLVRVVPRLRLLLLLLVAIVGQGQQQPPIRVVDATATATVGAFLPTQQHRRRARRTDRCGGSPSPYPPMQKRPLTTMSVPIVSSSPPFDLRQGYSKHEDVPVPATEAAAAAAAAAAATTNDDDSGVDEDSTNGCSSSSSSSSSSHRLHLDRFAELLHESLANAAAQHEGTEDAEARRLSSSSSSAEHDPKEEGSSNGAMRASSSTSSGSSPTMHFQALTVDFAAAAAAAAKAKRKTKNPGGSSPVSGSVKRITGGLVRLEKPSSSSSSSSRRTRQRKGMPDNNPTLSRTVVLQVTHKYHGATDIVKNYPVDRAAQSLHELLNWMLRRMELREQPQPQQQDDEEEGMGVGDGEGAGGHDDVPAAVASVSTEWGIAHLVPSEQVTVRATLDTTAGRYVLAVPPSSVAASATGAKKKQQTSSLQHFPSTANSAQHRATAIREHDRPRNRKVSIEDEFWKLVGVTTIATASSGDSRAAATTTVAVKPDMIAKVRQCEKFVEIVDGLVREVGTTFVAPPNGDATASVGQPAIRITDLGCGKGYLTYALHAYLQNKQLRKDDDESDTRLYPNVASVGIDIRPKLVRELNQIASDLRIEGLRFEQGSIQDACLGDAADAGATTSEPGTSDKLVQVFIALHACDTATDDALFSAIQRGADVIVTAPCCHKQLRPQINDLVLGGWTSKDVHPLADVLRHGIYRERTSEIVTDAIRAMLLELAGYKTNVFEFVGGEHTAKNCMITGIRCAKRSSAKDLENIRNRIRSLAEFYGIRHHKLADWMGEQSLMIASRIGGGKDDVASTLPARRSTRNMPPL